MDDERIQRYRESIGNDALDLMDLATPEYFELVERFAAATRELGEHLRENCYSRNSVIPVLCGLAAAAAMKIE